MPIPLPYSHNPRTHIARGLSVLEASASATTSTPREQPTGRCLVLAAHDEALVLLTVADAVSGPTAATRCGGGVASVGGAEGPRFVCTSASRPAVPVTNPESCREVVSALGTGEDAALVGIAVPRDLVAMAWAAL